MTDKIAIMGSGILAKIFAERAKELGIESHCFSFDPTDLACSVVDYFYEVNIFDTNTITNICKKKEIGGVIATTELTIYPTAVVAANIGALGNDIDVANNITNKFVTREKVIGNSRLKQPRYWVYIEGKIPEIKYYPVIVKPIAAGGKRGICVANTFEEMTAAIKEALSYSKVKGVLIEEFLVGGMEYSIESLSYKGRHYIIQVTQKDTSGPPHCNELGHHQPADLSDDMRRKVEIVVSDTLAVVGIENGPCHTEIKIIDDDIYLIEINGRPGGDHITYPLSELSTGYPTISGIIWAALGKLEGKEPCDFKRIPCGIYFVTQETSYLQGVFEKCENYEWLYYRNKVNDGPSKIKFNDEDGLNYFIYYGEKPDLENFR
ncbi:ATP-grasp domain-containing protein [Enterococcus faecium]|uniref:ATP-grasp domain-containing protein n=1 Tax=Enterococcus TaxID=1350 RepID=UPI000F4EE1A9|nr:ATP-grasp domain-containing protein [Enterococcus faecium]EGP4746874.1 ATP-grasp domain-containing protein [Enterococcus faecium]EGP5210554.1 ATP-grasp domain-containing protein [Enterococcus faecium]EGP5625001.1 ATP-grasp domain-containing protein [Enterococcus faecium]EME3521781.1 ATP-grasp domain-containing protein [Enterococcus faecium]EMF0349001.1 ATP-grasp domain-containing protein [Enterococcus faecium]